MALISKTKSSLTKIRACSGVKESPSLHTTNSLIRVTTPNNRHKAIPLTQETLEVRHNSWDTFRILSLPIAHLSSGPWADLTVWAGAPWSEGTAPAVPHRGSRPSVLRFPPERSLFLWSCWNIYMQQTDMIGVFETMSDVIQWACYKMQLHSPLFHTWQWLYIWYVHSCTWCKYANLLFLNTHRDVKVWE